MKKFVLWIMTGMLIVLLAGCEKDFWDTQGKGPSEQGQEDPEKPEKPKDPEKPENPEVIEKTEKELLHIMDSEAGFERIDYTYADLDQDGLSECIGVYAEDTIPSKIWYCSSDGTKCMKIAECGEKAEMAAIELIDQRTEMHVAVNTYNSMGTASYASVFALKDKEPVCLLSHVPGNIYTTEDYQPALLVDAYDGMYDPWSDVMMMHTYKSTYLYYDKDGYKEYGATELTEEKIFQFKNAAELKSQIEMQQTTQETEFLEFRYFVRKNGMVHIQCNVHEYSGEIYYGYYTVRVNQMALDENLGEWNPGQMEEAFTDLAIE